MSIHYSLGTQSYFRYHAFSILATITMTLLIHYLTSHFQFVNKIHPIQLIAAQTEQHQAPLYILYAFFIINITPLNQAISHEV